MIGPLDANSNDNTRNQYFSLPGEAENPRLQLYSLLFVTMHTFGLYILDHERPGTVEGIN